MAVGSLNLTFFFELVLSHYYPFLITIVILSATQIGLLGGFYLGRYPCGIS